MSRDYERIERAITFMEEHFRDQPSLKDVAAHAGLSEYHFQRLFRRWAGISPKRFLQFLTAERARRLLRESRSVLDVAFEVGLSGPGRLHDLSVNIHAATPGEVKMRGAGLTIRYGFHPSPFGECLMGITRRGVCWLSFVPTGRRNEKIIHLKQQWPEAVLKEDRKGTRGVVDQVFTPSSQKTDPSLALFVKGTNLQVKVWEALLRVPFGTLISYSDLARRAGLPGAARAVGTAVGKNPVAYLIPCHRVIKNSGAFGQYGSGRARKKAILGWEAARSWPGGRDHH